MKSTSIHNQYKDICCNTLCEMTKYAADTMLVTRISFMNDITNFCEILGSNVNIMRKGIGSDCQNRQFFPSFLKCGI
ncbi:MAG: hypothetical protein EOM50_09180 [Erysipelotrichia bacterium]|nr:hypothetical protein [Erysipelotrichia bacterium]